MTTLKLPVIRSLSEGRNSLKLIATIRPKETRTIEAEAEDYETAKTLLLEKVPEGWEVLQILNIR